MLHPSKLGLNSLLTAPGTTFSVSPGYQPIAHVHHRFYLQAKLRELGPQPVDVNVETLGIERLIAAPYRHPELLRSDDAIGRARQPRKDQKLSAREFQWRAATRDVVIP